MGVFLEPVQELVVGREQCVFGELWKIAPEAAVVVDQLEAPDEAAGGIVSISLSRMKFSVREGEARQQCTSWEWGALTPLGGHTASSRTSMSCSSKLDRSRVVCDRHPEH